MPRVSEIPKDKVGPLHMMFLGEGGTWKTTCAASFPKPFFLDVDKGIKVVKNLPWAQQVEFEQPSSIVEFEEILRSLAKRSDIETLVIDSSTTLEDMVLYHLCKMNNKLDEHGRPTKNVGVDIYGKRVEWYRWLGGQLLCQNCNTIFICHEEMVREYEDMVSIDKKTSEAAAGSIIRRPAMPGKCPDQMPGLVDEVWRFSIMPGAKEKLKIQIQKGHNYMAKSRARGILNLPGEMTLTWGESLWDKIQGYSKGGAA